MSTPDRSCGRDAGGEPKLFCLPGEIRNLIYELVAVADLETFVEKMTKPGLLQTSKQLREEYIDIFFGSTALQIDAYNGPMDGWKQIRDKEDKRAIFEESTLLSLTGFWSLGSTRRYCQREYSNYQGNVQNGIMTIRMRSGIHRW